jgi:hypothetical protein
VVLPVHYGNKSQLLLRLSSKGSYTILFLERSWALLILKKRHACP